jgi:hypothetical protein
MADQAGAQAKVKVVHNLNYDDKTGTLSWTFGTLVFDADRKLEEFKEGTTVYAITFDPKPTVTAGTGWSYTPKSGP